MKIWLDGRIVPADEARISVLDHGLLYGDGIFEGIRIRHGKLFRLDDHLARLEGGCAAVGIELPGGRARAREAALGAARALDTDEAYLRLVVTRGEGPLGIDPTECRDPVLFCVAGTIQLFDPAKLEAGLDLVTSWLRRPSPDVLDPRIKSLNYLNNVLAKREAKMRGVDEALLLNAQGRVAEASGANLFIVRRGELLTPPTSEGALEGITRRTVLELAPGLGLPTFERALVRADLLDADEVFLTGSGAGVAPVGSLDGVAIGDGSRHWSGSLFAALQLHAADVGTSFRASSATATRGAPRA